MYEFNPPGLPKSTDVGTRYQHLADLLDIWRAALQIIKQMNPAHRGEGDANREIMLEHAVFLLEKHIDTITGYKGEWFDLNRMLDSVPKDPTTIKGGRGTPLKNDHRPNFT